LPPSIPIIGCGGISSGADAIDFLHAGASLVQAYTAFGYAGVGFPRELKDEISGQLKASGTTWSKEVETARSKWTQNVDRVGQELQAEADRLKDVLRTISLIPREDRLAEQGLGGPSAEFPPSQAAGILTKSTDVAPPQSGEATPLRVDAAPTQDLEASSATTAPTVVQAIEGMPSTAEAITAAAQDAAPEATQANDDTTESMDGRADTLAWRHSVNAGEKRLV
jgi:dihydroorotate dehydrogenase